MRNLKNKTVFGALLMAAVGLSGCSAGLKAKQDGGAGTGLSLDPGAVNQAPKIACQVSNPALPNESRTLNTLSELDTFFTTNPRAGDNLNINCGSTSDEAGVAAVQFFIDTNYDPAAPDWQPVTDPNFTLPTATAGSFPMAIRALDPDGAERIKTFTMVVTCPTVIMPVLDTAGVSVTATGKLNFFDYSVSASAVSGGTNFSFSWDFNGDKVFDPYSFSDLNSTWTSSNTVSNIYTIFASTAANPRKIGVKVRNECMYESSYEVAVVQEIPNIDRTPTALAVPKPYYYLQADIHGTPSTNQRVNGDYITTQYPSEPVKRVQCDYKFSRVGIPAIFSIKGLNWYKVGATSTDSANFLHGMEVRIQGIPDQGIQGEQSFTKAANPGLNVATATYKVSAGDDGIISENYSRIDQACDVSIRVVRGVAVSPCAADQRLGADFTDTTLTITGEFDCPQLTNSSTSKSVAANNGKFFCEVSTSNQCVGGGGGGGGKPPPQQ